MHEHYSLTPSPPGVFSDPASFPQVRTEYADKARTDVNRPAVRTTAGAPPKSEKRDTAERSIVAALGLVVAMGATQFVPGDSSKQRGTVRTQHQ